MTTQSDPLDPIESAVRDIEWALRGMDADARTLIMSALCERVGAWPANTSDPDPLLSIRKSRLEAALRAAYTEGADVGGGAGEHVAWAQIDTYIARALTELEQA